MYREGTKDDDVQMSDVLCDFCHRPWTEDVPFIEGHRGAMICARCLELAYVELESGDPSHITTGDYMCRMSRESEQDRIALRRAGEPGWRSPIDPEAVVCRKVVRMAAATLQKDPDFQWQKPATAPGGAHEGVEGGDRGGPGTPGDAGESAPHA